MTEELKYMKAKARLEKMCEDNGLSCLFIYGSYPMTLSIRPLQGVYDQLSFLEDAEDGKGRISQDAVLTFIKRDSEIVTKICGTFTLPDKKMQTMKNYFKNLCSLYAEFFHRTVVEGELLSCDMPVPEDEG